MHTITAKANTQAFAIKDSRIEKSKVWSEKAFQQYISIENFKRSRKKKNQQNYQC